jgi:pimeloyl-ACP methyl ester carboxylesterase
VTEPLPGERWISSADAELSTEVRGAGAPILLLHGWSLDRRIFAPQIDALAGHFTVVAFDRRGFGRSRGEPDLRRELDDIDRVLDAFADSPAHILGMSQGARLALRYAVTRPQRLRSLVLQGVVVDGIAVEEPEEERIPLDYYAKRVRQGRLDEFRKHWLRHPMMRVSDDDTEAAELIRSIVVDYRGADLLSYGVDAYAFDMNVAAALETLSTPTLILSGAHETASRREQANRLCRLLPDAREVVLENGGHLCNLTEPAAYNQAVIEFCERVEHVSRRRPQHP